MLVSRCCASVSQKKSDDRCVRLRKRASLARSSSSVCLRCRNWPNRLPIACAASSRRSSGSPARWPEKASRPIVLPCATAGKAKVANAPARLARRLGEHRLAVLPGGARAAEELLGGRLAREPALLEGDLAARRIDAEAAAVVPALDVADRAQPGLQALGDAARLRQGARHCVLEPQELLAALLRGDVAADAVVALEGCRRRRTSARR